MSIGIINVQWFDNPGAVLLCYAMQYEISYLGFESEVIDFTSGGGSKYKPSLIKKVTNKCKRELDKIALGTVKINGKSFGSLLRERHCKYEKFRKDYLIRTDSFNNQDNAQLQCYDTYIVGSDVVWKPEIVKSQDAKVYFLDFLDDKSNAKRISFAASVGTNEIAELQKLVKQYKYYLDKFDYISMREKESAEFFRKYIEKDIETLIDPVFLLQKAEYSRLINEIEQAEKYIYFYMLAPNEEMVNFAEKLVKETEYTIIYDIHDLDNLYLEKKFGKYGHASIDDGPIEFLKRIRNAEVVITNSFHGTAFSLIFEKNFYTFGCINAGINVSLRMENILKKVCLYDRYNPKWRDDFHLEAIAYEDIRDVIENERNKAITFLKKAIEEV